MLMELWNYFGPPATALWNMHDARAGESTEATEYDSDLSATEHPLEDNLLPYLRPCSAVLDLSDRVADALGEVKFYQETPNVLNAGLAELDKHVFPKRQERRGSPLIFVLLIGP